jgi:vacuolar iron transporter family protein
MNEQVKKGFGFGIASGIITTLGLIIGLYFSTYSKAVIIGGILIIAISDAMSDSLGMHISEEFAGKSVKDIWVASGSTFFFKFLFAIIFAVWFLFFELQTAIIFSIIWGIFLLVIFSYYLAKIQKNPSFKVISEHVFIMILVIVITYFVGNFIGKVFV